MTVIEALREIIKQQTPIGYGGKLTKSASIAWDTIPLAEAQEREITEYRKLLRCSHGHTHNQEYGLPCPICQCEAQERELVELRQIVQFWKADALSLVTLLRAKVDDSTWETLKKTFVGQEYTKQQRRITELEAMLAEVVEVLDTEHNHNKWHCESCQFLKKYHTQKYAALHPTPEKDK